MIYRPDLLPDDFVPFWNKLAIEAGFDGIYFIGRLKDPEISEKMCKAKHINIFTCERWASGYQKNSF